MRTVVARIVLLIYLIGGLVIPTIHQHGSVGHDHGSHPNRSCQPAVASQPIVACGDCDSDALAKRLCQLGSKDAISEKPVVAQTPVAVSDCGELCTVCSFSELGQRVVARVDVLHYISASSNRLAFVDQPIRDRSFLDPSAPRGPPLV
jgi:hypothetical protein